MTRHPLLSNCCLLVATLLYALRSLRGQDCPSGAVRLAGGTNHLEGRVEVCLYSDSRPIWGTVCNRGWSRLDAEVVCRQLGVPQENYSQIVPSVYFDGPELTFHWTNTNCTGDETHLVNCSRTPPTNECRHYTQAIGVICSVQSPECDGGSVRIIDTHGNLSTVGRVEYCLGGRWGSVCLSGWGDDDAKVVCRQLGITGANVVPGAISNTQTPQAGNLVPIGLDSVHCNGREGSLSECLSAPYVEGCTHMYDVGVNCTPTIECFVNGSVQLVGGDGVSEGRVEYCRDHLWTSVCPTSWDHYDAQVVCRQLGFIGVSVSERDRFPPDYDHSDRAVFGPADCTGNETQLSECSVKSSSCFAVPTAGVKCYNESNCEPALDVRLRGGALTEEMGTVELCYGDWGFVCDDHWDDVDARVICRQLGLTGGVAIPSSPFGTETGRFLLDDLGCTGDESSVTECSHPGLGSDNCMTRMHEQAAVICGTTREAQLPRCTDEQMNKTIATANTSISVGSYGVCEEFSGQSSICASVYSEMPGYVYHKTGFDQSRLLDQLGQVLSIFQGNQECIAMIKSIVCHYFLPPCGGNGTVYLPRGVCSEECSYVRGSCNNEWMSISKVLGFSTLGVINCTATQSYLSPLPSCCTSAGVSLSVDCGTLSLPNGEFSINQFTATFSCNSGYKLVGKTSLICQRNGQWSDSLPSCQAITCGSLSDPDNGQVRMTNGTQLGSEAIYSCSYGYRLAGDATRICEIDEDWSGSPPDCTLDAVIGFVGAIALSLFLAVVSLIGCCAVYHRKKGLKPPVEHVETIELTHQPSSTIEEVRRDRVETTFFQSRVQDVVELIPQSLRIPRSHLKMSSTSVGQGEFGIVYKGLLMDWNCVPVQEVAVKALKGLFTWTDVENLVSEIIEMQEFNHPHVMPLIGVCLDTGPGVSMVMPFMANGSLLDYLKKKRSSLVIRGGEPVKVLAVRRLLLRMCHQVALGMEYLTQQKFIHRDLAARNCMLDSSGNIKVGDFGLAEDIYNCGYFRQKRVENIRLPYKWMAVESLTDNIFSEKTDVWSYGVTMWEIFSGGQNPYPAVDSMTLTQLLKDGRRLYSPRNDACSLDISALMARCWYVDPKERPGFSDLCSILEQFLSLISDYTELKMVLLEDAHDHEDIETSGVSALVGNSVRDSEKSTTVSTIDLDRNIAYRAPKSMSAAENVACVDQVSTVVNENTSQAEYDDFSSLKSRVPRLAQKSARGFENPITTAALQYENIAHEATKVAENVRDAGVNAEYDDFSSLRSRPVAQLRKSAEDTVMTRGTDEHVDHHVLAGMTDCLLLDAKIPTSV